MRPVVAARLMMTAGILQAFIQNRGLLPLDEKTLARYAWRIMGRQAAVAVAFMLIQYGVLICCALAGAALLDLDPLRGAAALLVIRFLLVGASVKASGERTQRRVLTATLEEACAQTKPDPKAPANITDALLQALDRQADQKPGEKN